MKLIGRTGKVAGHDVTVRDLLKIGAGPDNDFRVVVSGVSRHHARIVRDGEAYWLEDAGSTNGTFLNGLRIARERLRHLDVITLGRDVDLITLEGEHVEAAAPAARAVEDAWLEPVQATDGGGRVDIPLGELTLGRLAPSNVLLDSPVISKLHARIQRSADQVIVQDLDSANGTFVNGQRIHEVTALKDGDALALGGSRHFRVHVVGDARRSRPQEVVASQTMVFDQEWKTRLVWSADELAQLEAERRRILDSAKKEPSPAAPPAQAKAVASPKPAAPAAAAPAPKVAAAPAPPVVVKPAAPPPPAPSPPPPPPAPAPPPAEVPKPAPPAPAPPPVEVPKPAPPAPPPPAPAPPAPKPAVPVAKPAAPDAPTADVTKAVHDADVTRPMAVPAGLVRGVRLVGAGATITLEQGRHSVGRTPGAAVPVLDPQVSRNHATLTVAATDVRLEDAGSANGTFVNGKQISGAVVLKAGDRVKFGSVEFIVELIS